MFLQSSKVGSVFPEIARNMIDGHWVLSFPDAEKTRAAKEMVDQSALKIRALYLDALAPLLSFQGPLSGP